MGCRLSKASGTTPGRSTTPNTPASTHAYPPEKRVDLKATYSGKGNDRSAGRTPSEFRARARSSTCSASSAAERNDAVVYLYHEFESPTAFKLPLSLGSDDTAQRLLQRQAACCTRTAIARPRPDQDRVDVDVKAGKNELLVKICQDAGGWAVYVSPRSCRHAGPEAIRKRLDRDFPPPPPPRSTTAADERGAVLQGRRRFRCRPTACWKSAASPSARTASCSPARAAARSG